MHNPILDRWPEDYGGYLIRTDFRIGIQIMSLLQDEDFEEQERVYNAVWLLFGNGIPDLETAAEGLAWFLTCGKDISNSDDNQERLTDLDFDSQLIASSFRKAYGIDITRANMHWFEFNMLMSDLGECSYTNTIQIRAKKIKTNMSTEEKEYYRKAKEAVKLPQRITKKDQEAFDEFMGLLKGGENTG